MGEDNNKTKAAKCRFYKGLKSDIYYTTNVHFENSNIEILTSNS